jgi:hypothetical protein
VLRPTDSATGCKHLLSQLIEPHFLHPFQSVRTEIVQSGVVTVDAFEQIFDYDICKHLSSCGVAFVMQASAFSVR